jgi:hypothetical protein
MHAMGSRVDPLPQRVTSVSKQGEKFQGDFCHSGNVSVYSSFHSVVTPSGICGLCKTRAAYIRNSPASGSNLGRFCRVILTGSTLQYLPWVASGVTPGEALCLGHCSTGGTLCVGYLPLNNALGTGPPPLHILQSFAMGW